MYAWPVLFPEQTNREDLLTTVALFDDDTGQAIDLSGRTLAAPGDFTTNVWTVTSGNVVTASASNITIKDYPFGNEMQAIALTVGLNLAIAAGAPVTIADTATGKNTLTGYVTSYAPATGAMVVQIGVAFDFEIRSKGRHEFDGGYGMSSSDIGTVGDGGPIIQAQLGSGVTVIDIGKVQVRIPASTMQMLRHKTYSAAMVMYDGQDTRQVFVGELPILQGRVSTAPFSSPASNPYGLP
jgi:hypothetical protein